MKIERKYIELALVLVLWLATIYFWSLPFQKNSLPYGDVDSSIHFSIADYMADKDKPIYRLPQYINFTQGKWRAGKLWYPPQYHLGIVLARFAGGERFLPMLLFLAMTSSSFVLTSYLLFRQLYGFTVAFFSSFLLMFSIRDILFYIWGLWPQVTSFAMTPLVLYIYYNFIDLADKGIKKPVYLYLSACFLAIQFFIHPQGALLSGTIALIFTIVFLIFRKKFPFTIKTILIGLIILAVVLGPFMHFTVSSESRFSENLGKTLMPKNWSNLFSWYHDTIEKYVKNGDVPRGFESFKETHGGYWILPFFLIGIIFIVLRRKNQDLLLLSWVAAFHLLINLIEFRPHRLVETEVLFLYPIAIIGLGIIPEFIEKLIPRTKNIVKYGLIAVLVYLALSSIGVAAYDQLVKAYKAPPMRISDAQVEAADWLKENTPENAEMFYLGPYVYSKKKWIRAVAQRKIYFTVGEGVRELSKVNMSKDYFIVDYTDLIGINSQQEIAILQEFEKQNLADKLTVYDKNNIGVYKLE